MNFFNSFFTRPAPSFTFTDEEINALYERNAKRVQEAKELMGSKYLLHPDHKIQKKQVASVLWCLLEDTLYVSWHLLLA